jgi:hypothetical protein
VHAPHHVAKAACGVADRGDRPRRRCVDEQLLPVDEIGSDGTPRIDAPPGSVDVNEAKPYLTDLGLIRASGDSQLAGRVYSQRFGRLSLTSTNEKLNRNVHAHLLRIVVVRANT